LRQRQEVQTLPRQAGLNPAGVRLRLFWAAIRNAM
jgi:hypothetical protein